VTNAETKKLVALLDTEGMSLDEFLECYGNESIVPGICMEPGCDGTANYEPDARNGYCPVCGKQSVSSGLVILGVI